MQKSRYKTGKIKVVRITTVALSFKLLLRGQVKYLSDFEFDYTLVSAEDDMLNSVLDYENVPHVNIPFTRSITPIRDFLCLLKLIVLLWKKKPHIVHSHTPKAGLIGMLAAWITQVPIRLHTVAGLPLMESTNLIKRVLILIEKITYRCATNIYPNSFGLKDIIRSMNLVRMSKVKVLLNGSSNGINTDYFNESTEVVSEAIKIKESLGINENDFVFCFVGRVVKDKGVEELISAFVKLYESDPRVKLLVVGFYESKLNDINESYYEVIRKNTNILNVGYKEDIRAYLASSNLLVLPSYREGFPNVLLQAGSMKLPCIATNINGCNEIILDGITGKLVEPKDKVGLYEEMGKMAKSPSLCTKMGDASRVNIVSKYNQNEMWRAIMEEYQSQLSIV